MGETGLGHRRFTCRIAVTGLLLLVAGCVDGNAGRNSSSN